MVSLALLRDPGAIAVIFFGFFLLVACAVRLWIKATRRIEAERLRSAPVEPCDFAAVISEHLALRDRHQEARELGRAA